MSLRDHEIKTLLNFIGKADVVDKPNDEKVELTKNQIIDLIRYSYDWGHTDGSIDDGYGY